MNLPVKKSDMLTSNKTPLKKNQARRNPNLSLSNRANTIKAGNMTNTYRGMLEKVPVSVGAKYAKIEKTAYDILTDLKLATPKIKNKTDQKTS